MAHSAPSISDYDVGATDYGVGATDYGVGATDYGVGATDYGVGATVSPTVHCSPSNGGLTHTNY